MSMHLFQLPSFHSQKLGLFGWRGPSLQCTSMGKVAKEIVAVALAEVATPAACFQYRLRGYARPGNLSGQDGPNSLKPSCHSLYIHFLRV
eukprot:s15_g4.t1